MLSSHESNNRNVYWTSKEVNCLCNAISKEDKNLRKSQITVNISSVYCQCVLKYWATVTFLIILCFLAISDRNINSMFHTHVFIITFITINKFRESFNWIFYTCNSTSNSNWSFKCFTVYQLSSPVSLTYRTIGSAPWIFYVIGTKTTICYFLVHGR